MIRTNRLICVAFTKNLKLGSISEMCVMQTVLSGRFDVEFILHAAALKQVPPSENFPAEEMNTNN